MFFSVIMIISFCFLSCQSGDDTNSSTNAPTGTDISPITPADNPTTTTTIQDIWVIDSINKKAPDSNYFSHGTPYFDFNLEKNTVNGHTGCNGVTGKVKTEGERLIFDSLVITNQTCKDKSFENKLLKGFRSGKTTYQIQNEKLYLKVDPNNEYIFRKIRRT
jgi:heat shock protein HslJ